MEMLSTMAGFFRSGGPFMFAILFIAVLIVAIALELLAVPLRIVGVQLAAERMEGDGLPAHVSGSSRAGKGASLRGASVLSPYRPLSCFSTFSAFRPSAIPRLPAPLLSKNGPMVMSKWRREGFLGSFWCVLLRQVFVFDRLVWSRHPPLRSP